MNSTRGEADVAPTQFNASSSPPPLGLTKSRETEGDEKKKIKKKKEKEGRKDTNCGGILQFQ